LFTLHSNGVIMKTRTWIAETIGLVAVVTLAVVATNWSIDFYGSFRGAKGLHLAGYGDVRIAKYLLNKRYVPDNFNSLIIGPSISGNWDGRGLERLSTYNDSLVGGNIVELKAIADQALASSQIRVVILMVHPYLTATHDFKTVPLVPRLNNEALGSVNLEEAYKQRIREKLHLDSEEFDAFGVVDFTNAPNKMNPREKLMMTPGTDFTIDPIAMQTYRDFESELHARNVQIIFVIPPFLQSIYAGKPEAFKKYNNMILADKAEQDQVIDFTSDEFTAFRSVAGNFRGVHLTNEAARRVVAVINERVDGWIREGVFTDLRGGALAQNLAGAGPFKADDRMRRRRADSIMARAERRSAQ